MADYQRVDSSCLEWHGHHMQHCRSTAHEYLHHDAKPSVLAHQHHHSQQQAEQHQERVPEVRHVDQPVTATFAGTAHGGISVHFPVLALQIRTGLAQATPACCGDGRLVTAVHHLLV